MVAQSRCNVEPISAALVLVSDPDYVGELIHARSVVVLFILVQIYDVAIVATYPPKFDKRKLPSMFTTLTARDIPDIPDESPQLQHRSCAFWNVRHAPGRLERTG